MKRAGKHYYTSRIYKKEAIRIAKELQYPQEVIDKISIAQSEDEVSRIMTEARHNTHEREMLNESAKLRKSIRNN